jgi:hypothetical protein
MVLLLLYNLPFLLSPTSYFFNQQNDAAHNVCAGDVESEFVGMYRLMHLLDLALPIALPKSRKEFLATESSSQEIATAGVSAECRGWLWFSTEIWLFLVIRAAASFGRNCQLLLCFTVLFSDE